MNDSDFLHLLDAHLNPAHELNPEMADTALVWVENNPTYGALHIWTEHRVSKAEVEQVLFEIPPHVEERRHPGYLERKVFWGATRSDRWIFIVCEERRESDKRFLTVITAFEPEDGDKYWEKVL